jgi:hypothetical protein
MKRTLLILITTIGISLSSSAQFVFTTTSATYTGNGAPASGNGAFYSYQPGYGAGNYVDNSCTTPASGTGANELGGFDPNVYDANTAVPARNGTIFYGGKIRNMYSGAPCTAATPSFGFTFNNSQVVDLTLAANQKLEFTYQLNTGTNFDVVLQLFNDNTNYNPNLTSFPYTFLADGASHTVILDFSSNISGTADLANIFQVSFTYPFDVKSPDFGLSFANIKLGSTVTGINGAQANIASSKLYPNPSTDLAKVELNLNSVSEVKVTLSDLMGKEIMTVAQGTTAVVNADINTANLNKGIYTVNYFIDGAAAKSELLMVK